MSCVTRLLDNSSPSHQSPSSQFSQSTLVNFLHGLLPWFVCMSGGLLFFYEFMQMNMFNSLTAPLMRTFHLDATGVGLLGSVYFYTNATLIFVAGNLLDRVSTRRLLLFAMTLCTIGTLGFSFAPTVWVAAIFRFFVGLGGAFCFLSSVKLTSRWFPAERMGLVIGVIVTMAMIGGWMGQMPLTFLIEKMGWREAIFVDGILGVILTAIVWCVVADRPGNQPFLTELERSHLHNIGLMRGIVRVLSNRNNWLAACYTSLMNLPIFLIGGFLGTIYLHQAQGLSVTQASMVSGMIFFGTVFGSPFAGWISDKLGRRCLPMYCGAIASFAVALPIIYANHLSYMWLLLSFFVLGFTTSTQVISYPTVAEHNESVLTSTAVSIVSMVTVYGGALLLPFAGWLLDLSGSVVLAHGERQYSALAYQHVMLIMPIAFVLALLCAFFLKETYCKPRRVMGEVS